MTRKPTTARSTGTNLDLVDPPLAAVDPVQHQRQQQVNGDGEQRHSLHDVVPERSGTRKRSGEQSGRAEWHWNL